MAKRSVRRARSADEDNRYKLHAKTPTQQTMMESIVVNDVTFAIGSAGAGKTHIAVALAADALDIGEIEKIVITRPVIEATDEKLGFLPGSLEEKMDPYIKPITDIFNMIWSYDRGRLETLMTAKRIEIAPLAFMRGRTFKDTWIICDEAQNMTPNDVRMLLTRLGEGSKMILTGDPTQRDRKGARGFEVAKQLLQGCPGISFVEFGIKDVVRHKTVENILKLWGPDQQPEAPTK